MFQSSNFERRITIDMEGNLDIYDTSTGDSSEEKSILYDVKLHNII